MAAENRPRMYWEQLTEPNRWDLPPMTDEEIAAEAEAEADCEEMENEMEIIRLEAENVKRLQAIKIKPDGNMVVIGGANGAGKSSVLDCIEYALAGKKHLPGVPLRTGTDHGHIILETDKYTVTRTFTETGSYIKVTTPEGYSIGTPQELLDKLVGDLSFDPLAFTRMDSKKQAELFKRLIGLDFSELDAEYSEIEESRKVVGRDGKQTKAQLDAMSLDADAPESEVVISDLMKELESARESNTNNERLYRARNDAAQNVTTKKMSVKAIEEQLAIAKQELDARISDYNEKQTRCEGLTDIDTTPLVEQIRNAETVNKRVRDAKQRKEHERRYTQQVKAYEQYTAKLREIESTKADMISNAAFPVDGITFGDSGVLVNGIPFEQASSAEQLRIAVAMGLSANPDLRVILIRDGSLLDESSLAAIAEMAEQYQAQVWMERVGDGAEVSVVIQDGMVLDNRIPVQKAEELA